MSDPRTNGEIEDVLSSIRRLVSEDEPVTSKKDDGSDRLVLTAALRVDDTDDKASSLADTVAKLEASVDAKAGQWGGEGKADFDPWEPADKSSAQSRGADVQDAEVIDATPEPEPNVGAPDLDSLLDENELRALVAEVLREELKGPLGERITRNVRKLVRREIAQALSSLDID